MGHAPGGPAGPAVKAPPKPAPRFPNGRPQPELKPAGPTGKVTVVPQPRLSQRGYMPPTRTIVTHAPKGPSEADLIFQREANAIGPKAVAAAANPRVAALQAALGQATGIPALTHAVRTHNALATAGDAAMLLPFGRIGEAVKAAVGVGKAAEEAAKIGGAAKAVEGSVAPTAKTLGESAIEGLQGAKQVRAGQESFRRPVRAERAQAFGKALQANPTVEGARQASAALKGKYPSLEFGGFKGFSPETLDAMVQHIAEHPSLQGLEFSQKRAIDAVRGIAAGEVPTRSDEKLLRQVFGPDTTKQMIATASRWQQAKALGYDVGNVPRSVMASFDVSGVLRQALLIATGHPAIWAKNVPDYLKAMKSEDFFNAGMQALHNRPNALNGIYDRMGVDLTEMAPRENTVAREEAFRSPLAEKIPGVRMSGRGFTLFLDQGRADLADHLYAKAVAEGKGNNPHTLQSIGDVVNSMSGRGDLGTGVVGRSQEGLNLLLFSPRLIKSRIDFLNPVWYAKLDPLARHQAYRAMGGLAVLMSTALGIARAAGAQVNLDPRSSDFAKIKIGNTRLDLAGGFQQYIRVLSELATQRSVTSTGKTIKLGQEGPGKTSDWDILFRFLRAKLAPVSSLAVDASQRQNSVGQPLSWQNTVLSRFTPLSAQDAVSVGQDAGKKGVPAGVLAGLGAFGLSAFGGGVQNYKPKQPKGRGGGFGSVYAPSSGGSGPSYAPGR